MWRYAFTFHDVATPDLPGRAEAVGVYAPATSDTRVPGVPEPAPVG